MSADPITEQIARDMLGKYLTAAASVASGQSYSIDGRSLTRANLKDIQAAIEYWRGMVIRLATTGSAGPTVRRVIPHG